MYKFLGFFIFLRATTSISADLPGSVRKCVMGDSVCLTKTVQEILKTYPAGLRELNLLPFDPLRVDNLKLERNPSGAVNLEFKFKDLDLIGLQKANVRVVKGLTFKERTVFEAVVPEFILKGHYETNGNVLILPVRGKGKSKITCKNLLMKYTFDLKPVNENGKIFAELEHVKLEIKPELVQFKFDNIFNRDNKALGETINKFINENWREIFAELETSFAKGLGLVIKEIINNVFSKFPFDSMFLN